VAGLAIAGAILLSRSSRRSTADVVTA